MCPKEQLAAIWSVALLPLPFVPSIDCASLRCGGAGLAVPSTASSMCSSVHLAWQSFGSVGAKRFLCRDK